MKALQRKGREKWTTDLFSTHARSPGITTCDCPKQALGRSTFGKAHDQEGAFTTCTCTVKTVYSIHNVIHAWDLCGGGALSEVELRESLTTC